MTKPIRLSYPRGRTVKGMLRIEKNRKQLLYVIDESMTQVFGETSTKVIYDHLERNHHLRREDIPENLETFSFGLEEMYGFGAILLERLILRKLYSKLGLKFKEKEGYNFLDYMEELKNQIIESMTREMALKI